MKAKMINTVHLEGLLYEHELVMKTSGENSKAPGTEFISGTLKVATDNAMTNIVEVHYTYVTEKTSKGGVNATFANLKAIIDGTAMCYVPNKAKDTYVPSFVRIDTAIGLNDFYSENNGKVELVSARRNEGGFLHFIRENELAPEVDEYGNFPRNKFEADMIVTNVRRIEADEEKDQPEKMALKGVIFDFRRGILPVEFVIYNPQGMELFESQEPSPSNPFCTKVNGTQISQVTVIRREEPSAFGPAIVKEYPRTRKEFEVISIFNQVSYPWDDSSFVTADELSKAVSDRETYLATVKQRYDEYQAKRGSGNANSAPASQTTVQAKAGGFNF